VDVTNYRTNIAEYFSTGEKRHNVINDEISGIIKGKGLSKNDNPQKEISKLYINVIRVNIAY